MTSSNLTDEISKQADIRPDDAAIIIPERIITFRELEVLIWKTATFLAINHIKQGDVVALTFASNLTAFITMLALARIGATVFSLSASSPAPLRAEMATSAKAIVLATDLPEVDDAGLPSLLIDINTISKTSSPNDFSVRDPIPRAPWIIATGSGSTGDPKKIPITHTQVMFRMPFFNRAFGLSSNDRIGSLISLNMLTTKLYFFYALCAGASIAMPDKQISGWVSDYRVSVLHAAVVHIENLLDVVSKGLPNPFGMLRILRIGASTVSDSLRKRIKESLTTNLYISYGTNEVGTAAIATPEDIAATPGTVGRPVTGVTVEVVDAEGKILPAGEVGFVRACGPGVMNSYLDDHEASQSAFKDGWFYTGDLGKFTPDGQLIYCGRSDHMMITNGINIYPAEIEAVITRHPAVRDAAAVPLRHPVQQDVPVCAVALHRGAKASPKELHDYAFQHLGNRSPRMIVVLEEIPRNHLGKLVREKLMKEIIASAQAAKPKS